MPKVSEQGLQAKLGKLSVTQASIESVTEYCLFYYEDAPRVVALWQQELQKAPVARKLSLVYLANHILQTAHKAKGLPAAQAFQGAFYQVLPKALAHCLQHADDKAKKGLVRIVDVWEQRRVFGSKQIRPLKDIVGGAGGAAGAAQQASGGGGGGGDDDAGVQELGVVGECLAAVLAAVSNKAAEEEKFDGSFTPDLLQTGGLQQVTAASTRLRALTAALTAEKEARQGAITALQAEIATQASIVSTLQQRVLQAAQQQQQLDARIGLLTQQMASAVAGLGGLGVPAATGQQVNGGGDAAAEPGFYPHHHHHHQQQQQPEQGHAPGAAGASSAGSQGSPQAPGMELEDDEGYDAAAAAAAAVAAEDILTAALGGAAGGAPAPAPAAFVAPPPQQQLMAALQGLPDEYKEKLGSDMQQLMASGLFTGGGALQLPGVGPPLAPGGAAAAAAPVGALQHLVQPLQQQQQQLAYAAVQPPGQLPLMHVLAGAQQQQQQQQQQLAPAAEEEDEPYDPEDD